MPSAEFPFCKNGFYSLPLRSLLCRPGIMLAQRDALYVKEIIFSRWSDIDSINVHRRPGWDFISYL